MKRLVATLLLTVSVLVSWNGHAQVWNSARWLGGLKDRYDARIDVVYSRVDSIENKLDVYVPKAAMEPCPTLIWIHGGGWGRLTKDSVSGQIIPYLENGWVVVNVDYRLTPQARAPAAVIDCRCALHWVVEHAEELKVDTRKIVVSGSSAGGHLALMTGMLPPRHTLRCKLCGCHTGTRGGNCELLRHYRRRGSARHGQQEGLCRKVAGRSTGQRGARTQRIAADVRAEGPSARIHGAWRRGSDGPV